ncbi:MAG: hypothetical protein AAF960_09895 [Bacteroidota bacterium]
MNQFTKTFSTFAFLLINCLFLLTSCQKDTDVTPERSDFRPTTTQMVGDWTAYPDDNLEVSLTFEEMDNKVVLIGYGIVGVVKGTLTFTSAASSTGYATVTDGQINFEKQDFDGDQTRIAATFVEANELEGELTLTVDDELQTIKFTATKE